MKLEKKQLILSALVLALGASVYLTWHFSGPETLPVGNEVEETSELGAAQLVNNAYIETVGDDLQEGEVQTETNKSLSEARISRQNARDQAIELLENIVQDVEADSEAKDSALTQASAIADNIMEETNIENLLSAKGFSESVAYISNGECNVVVSGEIQESDGLIIQEIVMAQTGLTADKIKIVSTK